jgi:hypothetical protein
LLLVALAWLTTESRADSFASCPGDKPSRDFGGLCYEPCKPGFVGVGPVCHRVKELRDGSCGDGEEKDGALCYPKCKAGYKGVGPVCWQSCLGGFRDDGAFCAKPSSYGRGAGYPWKFGDKLGSLSAAKKRCKKAHEQGCEKEGAIYYPKCKQGFSAVGCCTCSPKCEGGMQDIGVSCAKQSYGRTAGTDPESYGRGVGVPLTSCSTSDISRSVGNDHTKTPFFLVLASDPQLSWYSGSGSGCSGCALPLGECQDQACRFRNAFKTNDHQLAAINAITSLTWPAAAAKVPPPRGVILNGDLTSYGQPEEWDWFMSYYVKRLKWPGYYGLGNHDYANNVGDCKGETIDGNWCAKNSIQWMRSTVSCGRSTPFPAGRVTGYHDKSMSYAWDIGPYHFVQLQNYPLFPTDEKHPDKPTTSGVPGIGSSFTWLAEDVKKATAAGQHIIINMHDFGEHMKQDNDQFATAIMDSNVRAIFAGHIHHDLGEVSSISVGTRSVKVFRTGSSVYQRFLLVEFADGLLRVGKIDSSDGVPKLLGAHPVQEVRF